jgi:hypothetical protein
MRAITFVRLTFCGLGLGVSIFGFAGLAQGQSLMENAAAAAGGSVGGVAGKQVSDGLSTIFGKIDQDTSKAAAKPSKRYTGPSEPLLEAGPGVPKTAARRAANKAANRAESVPPPPPLPTHGPVHKTAAVVPPPVPVIEPPPPTPAAADDGGRATYGHGRHGSRRSAQAGRPRLANHHVRRRTSGRVLPVSRQRHEAGRGPFERRSSRCCRTAISRIGTMGRVREVRSEARPPGCVAVNGYPALPSSGERREY